MGQAVGHDKRHGIVLHDVGPGENRQVDPAGGVGRGQHPMAFGLIKIRFRSMLILPDEIPRRNG